jgi:ATP-dependent RNA helicase RhlE
MTQYKRQEVMEAFDGSLKILVATDIAARGLDILTISHVVNYDMPDTTDAYTHRIGRTGRVDNTGEAFTLVTHEDKDMIKALERIFKKPIENRKISGFNYSADAPSVDDSMPRRALYRNPGSVGIKERSVVAASGARSRGRQRPALRNKSANRARSMHTGPAGFSFEPA